MRERIKKDSFGQLGSMRSKRDAQKGDPSSTVSALLLIELGQGRTVDAPLV